MRVGVICPRQTKKREIRIGSGATVCPIKNKGFVIVYAQTVSSLPLGYTTNRLRGRVSRLDKKYRVVWVISGNVLPRVKQTIETITLICPARLQCEITPIRGVGVVSVLRVSF